MPDTPPDRLSGRDSALLSAFCLALFLVSPLIGPQLTGHNSVLAQNSREMLIDRDWLVPKVGGEVWLERPPPPDWVICAVYAVAGVSANDGVARLAAVLVAVPLVLIVAHVGALLYGRSAGLMAGGIFATMYELYSYASNPEADIFLCLIVTATVAAFARLEFGPRADRAGESGRFVGTRPWAVLAFFALLGATNLAKGVIFGTVMAGLPAAGYLIWNRSWGPWKRYVWLWGWLAAAAVALAWPAAVIVRYPEIVELWKEHYSRRLNHGYLAEPWWYYAAAVPFVLLPWTPAALIGLWRTRTAAFAGPGPERFLWCWAVLPPAVFSLADGKHHHYLLYCMPAWAILAVNGAAAVAQFCRERLPRGAGYRWAGAGLVGGTAAALVLAYRAKLGGPDWLAPAAAGAVGVLVFGVARVMTHSNPRTAFVGVLAGCLAAYALLTGYLGAYRDSYRSDAAFTRRAAGLVPADEPLFVHYDWVRPLETFWVLYHTPRPGTLVRDPWELWEKADGRSEAFVLCRRMDEPALALIGTVQMVTESELTRLEPGPEYRRVLYRVRFHTAPPPGPPELLAITRRTLW